MLQFTHLVTVEVEAHLLGGRNQFRVDWRVIFTVIVIMVLFIVPVIFVIVFVFSTVIELLFINDLFYLLVNVVFLAHHRCVRQLHRIFFLRAIIILLLLFAVARRSRHKVFS